ncbi:MAG: hypothetical protein RLZZ426_89 [Actinomycetota bacterium]
MKTIIAITAAAGLTLAGFTAFALDSNDEAVAPLTSASVSPTISATVVESETAATETDSTQSTTTPALEVQSVSNNEIADMLTFIVQEEKLAHDLYVKLADSSGVRKFSNILKSEAKHVSAVQTLLATYGITDPTIGLDSGEFVNQDLQSLYNSLLASGSASTTGAIAAGVAVEETDIADIEKMLESELPADIRVVLEQLLSASYNHLAAFTR